MTSTATPVHDGWANGATVPRDLAIPLIRALAAVDAAFVAGPTPAGTVAMLVGDGNLRPGVFLPRDCSAPASFDGADTGRLVTAMLARPGAGIGEEVDHHPRGPHRLT